MNSKDPKTHHFNNEILSENNTKSPCVNICIIHPSARICVGCYRNAEEIRKWPQINDKERMEILSILPNRSTLLKKRRGGRKKRLAGKL